MNRLIFLLLLLIAACVQPVEPPTPNNNLPVSSFTALEAVQAGAPLVLDGSVSSDADGDALTFSWDLGDGTKGGTAKLAHVYADGGTFTIKLMVSDGKGGVSSSQRTVTVAAPPAPSKTVTVLGVVKNLAGQPLEGVKLEAVGEANSVLSNAEGKVSLTGVGAGNNAAVTVKLSKDGFAEQFKLLELPSEATSGYFEVTLQPRANAQILPDAAAGGNLTGTDGAKLELPAAALVDGSGNPVTGAVQVNLTPVDVDNNITAFPGKFEGTGTNGQQGLILSYGTVEFNLSQNGQEVNLAPGKQASIEIPIYTALNKDGSAVKIGDTYPLWSLNEQTSLWTQEGTGVVVSSSASPSGLALRGQVAHFSWWNHDDFAGPSYKPKPKCLVDTNADGILEDLTGTAHCWHAGTGPEQPDDGFGASASLRPQNIVPRIPAFMAEDTTPVGGGKILEMPADLSVTVRSSALDGTLAATTIFKGAANVEEDVIVVLKPVATGSQDVPITLPWDQNYSISAANEKDRFRFTSVVGQYYEIRAARNGSSLNGNLKAFKGATQISSKGINSNEAVLYLAGDGTEITLEVSGSNTGGYNLRASVVPVQTMPYFDTLQDNTNLFCGANGERSRFVQALAGQTLAIRLVTATNQSPFSGSLKLFAADGTTSIVSDTFTTSSDAAEGAFLTSSITQSGTYRIESTWKGICTVQLSVNVVQPVTLNTNTSVGDITNAYETRTFRFTGQANSVVNAAANNTSLPGGGNSNISKMAVELYNSAGVCLGTTYRAGTIVFGAQLEPVKLSADGDYFVVIRPTPCPACTPIVAQNITLGVSTLEPEVPSGASFTVPFDVLGKIRYYKLNLNAGDVLRVIPTGLSQGTRVELNVRAPSSNDFFEHPKLLNNNANQANTVYATTTGEYLVEMRGILRDHILTGNLQLELQQPTAQNLGLDMVLTGSTPALKASVFNFTIPSTAYYQCSSFTVTRADGTTFDCPNNIPQVINAGSYKIILSNSTTNAQPYELVLFTTEDPAPITLGATLNGETNPARELDYYSFSGTQGQAIKVTVTSGSQPPQILVYRLNNNGNFTTITSGGANSSTNTVTYTPTTTGMYIIRVQYEITTTYSISLSNP
jgi:hypothetical protein